MKSIAGQNEITRENLKLVPSEVQTEKQQRQRKEQQTGITETSSIGR